ncbi:MAG: hypothetical protein ACREL1_00190 [bacterium]
MKPLFLAIFLLFLSTPLWAQSFIPTPPPAKDTSNLGFAKPYEYERQAYGYDPDGVQYKENQAEDFQVIFITSAPFAALASMGLTGLASTLISGKFEISGPYFIPFLAGTVAGATTAACVSVLTNPYPAPDAQPVLSEAAKPERLVLAFPIVAAYF